MHLPLRSRRYKMADSVEHIIDLFDVTYIYMTEDKTLTLVKKSIQVFLIKVSHLMTLFSPKLNQLE